MIASSMVADLVFVLPLAAVAPVLTPRELRAEIARLRRVIRDAARNVARSIDKLTAAQLRCDLLEKKLRESGR